MLTKKLISHTLSALLFLAGFVWNSHAASADEQISATGDVFDGGNYFHCAIAETGYVSCWGGNQFGETDVPADLGQVTAISSGGHHTCAITVNELVRCWGINRQWEANVTKVPADLGKVKQITAGWYYTCAITVVGNVRCWGNLDAGMPPTDLGEVIHISAGWRHMCALTSDSEVRCWGINDYGQTNVPVDLGKVSQIDVRYMNSCAITLDGFVRCWGMGGAVPSDLGKVSQIAGGGFHTCAVTVASDVKCWGGDYGQSNVPSDLGQVIAIGEGSYSACAAKSSGEIRCWGGGQSLYVPQGFKVLTLRQSKALSQTNQPVLIGNFKVGQTLTIDSGVWDSGVSFLYQWLRDGLPIEGATSTSYTLEATDYLKKLSAAVAGSKTGYESVTRTSDEFTVYAGTLNQSSLPQVSGFSTIGATLNADQMKWVSGTTTAFQWLRDGVAITSATSSAYTLQPSDYLKKISVSVTGSKEGYVSETKISESVIPVQAKDRIASLRFTGSFKVGAKAFVSPVNRNSKFDYSYQWLRNGEEIAGASSRTYQLAAEDVGSTLSAKVCALYLKDVIHCVSQDIGSPVELGVLKNVRASFSGLGKVGRLLSAAPAIFDNQASVSYQWLRNGVPIEDATRNSYFADQSDKGSSISLRVTVSKPGYETVVKTSNSKLIN